ncbi:hypothetical protein MMC25_003036 [Agyrium rufum]|nr:hypothetical protein [Agyrium rufum]
MFDDVQTPTSPWRKNTTDDTVVFDILHSPTLPPQSPMGIRTRDTLNRPLPATPSIPEVTELSPINPVPVEAPNNQDPPPFSPGPSSSRRPDRSSRWGSFSLWRGKSAITDDEDNLRDQASPLGHTEEGFDTVVDGHRQRHSSSSSRGMPLGRLSHYSVAPPYKSRPASKVVDGIAELEAGPSEVEPRPESIMEDPTITDGDHRPDGPSSGQAPNRSSMYKGQWNGR